MLLHIPLFTHEKPEEVLIVGGGDGGAVESLYNVDTRYYNHDLYKAAFVLPTFLQKLLENDNR